MYVCTLVACSRLSVVGDGRALSRLALVLPRFFLARFRSSPTTESLEQASILAEQNEIVMPPRAFLNLTIIQKNLNYFPFFELKARLKVNVKLITNNKLIRTYDYS